MDAGYTMNSRVITRVPMYLLFTTKYKRLEIENFFLLTSHMSAFVVFNMTHIGSSVPERKCFQTAKEILYTMCL